MSDERTRDDQRQQGHAPSTPGHEMDMAPEKQGVNGAAPFKRSPGDHQATYAALDLGTNNCRLLIARPHTQGFRVVDAFSRIVRLGEGLGANGYLNEAAMGRAIEALKVCADKISLRGAERCRLIATEACRAASPSIRRARAARRARRLGQANPLRAAN